MLRCVPRAYILLRDVVIVPCFCLVHSALLDVMLCLVLLSYRTSDGWATPVSGLGSSGAAESPTRACTCGHSDTLTTKLAAFTEPSLSFKCKLYVWNEAASKGSNPWSELCLGDAVPKATGSGPVLEMDARTGTSPCRVMSTCPCLVLDCQWLARRQRTRTHRLVHFFSPCASCTRRTRACHPMHTTPRASWCLVNVTQHPHCLSYLSTRGVVSRRSVHGACPGCSPDLTCRAQECMRGPSATVTRLPGASTHSRGPRPTCSAGQRSTRVGWPRSRLDATSQNSRTLGTQRCSRRSTAGSSVPADCWAVVLECEWREKCSVVPSTSIRIYLTHPNFLNQLLSGSGVVRQTRVAIHGSIISGHIRAILIHSAPKKISQRRKSPVARASHNGGSVEAGFAGYLAKQWGRKRRGVSFIWDDRLPGMW